MTQLKADLPLLKMALPAIITILAGKLLFELYLPEFPSLIASIKPFLADPALMTRDINLHELSGRLFWIGSVLLYLFVNSAFLLFLRHINQCNQHKKPFGLIGALSALLIFELGYLIFAVAENSPLKTIFHFTFDLISLSVTVDQQVIASIPPLVHLINLASILAPLYTIYTACRLATITSYELDVLATHLTQLNGLIKASSMLMISGIIHMQLWLHWPLQLIPNHPDIDLIKRFIQTVIEYWSVCYTLTIAALYIPLAYHLKQQAIRLCREQQLSCEKTDLPEWLGENPLSHSLATQLPQLVAILGPILAGTLVPSLNNLFNF
jgi:hypothetical protein